MTIATVRSDILDNEVVGRLAFDQSEGQGHVLGRMSFAVQKGDDLPRDGVMIMKGGDELFEILHIFRCGARSDCNVAHVGADGGEEVFDSSSILH